MSIFLQDAIALLAVVVLALIVVCTMWAVMG